jgi:hypothetical protein
VVVVSEDVVEMNEGDPCYVEGKSRRCGDLIFFSEPVKMNLPEAVNMRVKASFSLPVFLETSRSSEYEGKTSFSFSDIFHKRLGWSRHCSRLMNSALNFSIC